MTWIEALILAIVEGLTEFLPVSSTGHMIITEGLLGMKSNDFTQLFIISIQFGTILSVVVLYWKRFFKSLDFYYKLFVAFLPAAVFGLLLNDYIEAALENVYVVAVMLVVGGVVLVFVDRWFKNPSPNQEITYPKALKIGLFQVIAMIPGVSRSAATIIGGMTQKLTRKTAAEFSFFLAVPTMAAATGYSILKFILKADENGAGYQFLTGEEIKILIFGNVVGFIVAILAIKSFINYLTKHGFALFGYYRIFVGLLILVLYFVFDVNLSID